MIWSSYKGALRRAMSSVEIPAVLHGEFEIETAITNDRQIFSCGNGGSAAISNHLHCDLGKGVAQRLYNQPRIQSLSANSAVMTAIANDRGFDETFSYQLFLSARANDLLIAISSSGNSPNIIEALEMAKDIGMRTIALTGFNRGKAGALADVNVHVASDVYGVVEDCHQAIMHCWSLNVMREKAG